MAAVALTGAVASAPALAQDDLFTVSGYLNFASDYRWRGLTQTDEHPAVQGELDLSHKSGLYVGVWASNIDYNDPDSHLELDAYVGFANSFAGIDYDVGIIYYTYPGDHTDSEYWELYADLAKDFGSFKVLGGLAWTTDYNGDDVDQYYVYGGLEVPVGKYFKVHGLVGYTDVDLDDTHWTHWELGVTASVLGLDLDLSYHDIDRDSWGEDGGVVFSVKKSF
jgi:conserved hypothetical protein, proteobacterial